MFVVVVVVVVVALCVVFVVVALKYMLFDVLCYCNIVIVVCS